MTTPILTAAEMRAAEAAAIAQGISEDLLMTRAGRAVANLVWRIGATHPALILCGPGNNGGDGYVAARLLAERGVPVRVAALGEPKDAAAAAARSAWAGPIETLAEAAPAPMLVDALFGTGLSRPLDRAVTAALRRLEAGTRHRIAIDLPSGVGTDDGALLGDPLRCDVTVALGALKPAHVLQPAAARCGRIILADIGVTADARAVMLVRPAIAAPDAQDHKYTRGMVAIVGGTMPGAARLAASAAAHAGAGYVLLLGGEGGRLPDAVVVRPISALGEVSADRRVGALLVGPGLGREDRRALGLAIGSDRPLVIDGDALHLLSLDMLAMRNAPAILTPHSGEFDALFGSLLGSKIDRTRAAAALARSVVIHKGADTVIAAPDGRVAVAGGASTWLSTAGTGDVLAGVVAALLARGLAPFDAACAAVWVHGEAARRSGPAFVADDLARQLVAAIGACA